MADIKVFVLFHPKQIIGSRPIFELRQLVKIKGKPDIKDLEITKKSLDTFFFQVDPITRSAIFDLMPNELKKIKTQIKTEPVHINNPELAEKKQHQKYINHLQTLFTFIRVEKKLALYFAATTDKKVFKTEPCSFYSYPVKIAVEVILEQGLYQLNQFIVFGKERLPLSLFIRYHFLLEKEHVFYQLTSRSYEALEWLSGLDNNEISSSLKLDEISEHLKKWDIKLQGQLNLNINKIEVLPQFQVMLSELNNTFLKLEPRFIYDIHLIDGPFEEFKKININGELIHIIRNKEKEEELVGFLRSRHSKFVSQRNGFFYLTFAEAQQKGWFLKLFHELLDMDIELIGMDMMKHFRFSQHKIQVESSNVKEDQNRNVFTLNVQFGKESVPLAYLQKALLGGQKAVMLKDGSLGVLGDDFINSFGTFIRHGKIKAKEIEVPKWLWLETEIEDQNSIPYFEKIKTNSKKHEDWKLKWQQWQLNTEPLYLLPEGLRIEKLRPYQQKGYEWLRLLSEIGGAGILADDMGLGKTLQAITFILSQTEAGDLKPHLVVAPASLIYNWQKEIEKFAPGLNVHCFYGINRKIEELQNDEYHVFITSYGTLRQNIEEIKSVAWCTIILDESQNIKNSQALVTKAAWQLEATTRIALSGTPVMNSTTDLFSQFHFLLPGLLGGLEFFKKQYAIPIEQKKDEERAAILQKIIRPFVLRRTKEYAAPDLPEKTETVLWCEMGTLQREIYEDIRQMVKQQVYSEIEEQGLEKGKLSVLTGLLRLRQACNSTGLIPADINGSIKVESIKTNVVIQEIRNIIPMHRVLVFSQFTSMLDLLENDMKNEQINTIRLDGNTSASKRQELVQEFQSEETDASVFLLSLKAGNAGLTLTKADYVFIFDPWWNTAVENQAIDRTHRIGQNNHVFAYRLICKDSIEEKIINMAASKKKLAEDLVSIDEGFVKSLTMEDIQYLIG